MAQSVHGVETIVADAEWLAHRFDAGSDAIQFRRTPRQAHRQATFLTDEYLGDGEIVAVPRAEALARIGAPAPVHFIFHSAFCCSTMLARALDIDGVAMALKEPVLLNDVSGWRNRGADPKQVATLLEHALQLLSRPFAAGEAVIVKPSNVINAYIPAILAMRPAAHALLLRAPLPVYLGSIARKGLWGRRWVRDLLAMLIRDGLVDLGFGGDDYFGLTDLQVAAVGWIAQQQLFATLVTRFGARVRTLDSETLLARQPETVAALAAHFGLELDKPALAEVLSGPAFASHSKTGAQFDRTDRDAERQMLEAAHADEIGKVLVWATAVADNAGVRLDAGAPLVA